MYYIQSEKFDLFSYDIYLICLSGGKDSIVSYLELRELGVPNEKIVFWHHLVDGKSGIFFDWEITEDYCRKLAEAFNVNIRYQWKEGGFRREMLRYNSLTAPTYFEDINYKIQYAGGEGGKPGTRLKFPQVTANLSQRYCSAYLKVNVCSSALRNLPEFMDKKILIISGERGEESPQRARYKIFEPDIADLRDGKKYKRHIDRFRIIRDRKEDYIWQLLEKYRIRVHPCYYMGWGRCSCKFCIFGDKNQFASAAFISPEIFRELIRLEKEFGITIKRDMDLQTLINLGTVYNDITPELAHLSTQLIYNHSIIIPENEKWILPAGAFKKGGGPS